MKTKNCFLKSGDTFVACTCRKKKRKHFPSLFWETGGGRSNSFFPWAELEMLSPLPLDTKATKWTGKLPSRKGFCRERANKAFFSPWITSKLLGKSPKTDQLLLRTYHFFAKLELVFFWEKKFLRPRLGKRGRMFPSPIFGKLGEEWVSERPTCLRPSWDLGIFRSYMARLPYSVVEKLSGGFPPDEMWEIFYC